MSAREADPRARARRAAGQRRRHRRRRAPTGGLGTLDHEERVALFCERVGDYRADVRRVAAPELAAGDRRRARGARRRGRPAGPAPGVRTAWTLVEDDGLSPTELDALDGVLTGCTVAIAETGTIVLAGGAGRRAARADARPRPARLRRRGARRSSSSCPRRWSVLGELVRRERRPLTFVSGPSATSDIELSRVEGVHGPRTLVVLVVAS